MIKNIVIKYGTRNECNNLHCTVIFVTLWLDLKRILEYQLQGIGGCFIDFLGNKGNISLRHLEGSLERHGGPVRRHLL